MKPAHLNLTLACLLIAVFAQGQISYTGGTYFEDFNTLHNDLANPLAVEGTGPLYGQGSIPGLSGWHAARVGGSGSTNIPLRAMDDTGTTVTAYSTGAFYSYGNASSTERALGSLASGSTIGAIGVSFVNNTGQTLNEVTISFRQEIWVVQGTSTQTQYENRMWFGYGLSSNGVLDSNFLSSGQMTTYPDLDVVAAAEWTILGTASGTDPDRRRDGNSAQWSDLVSATIAGVNWAPGETLYLRWIDFDQGGFDTGMAIDDFSMSAVVPEPATLAFALGLLAGLAVWLRRRR